jgi:hypothetical protein
MDFDVIGGWQQEELERMNQGKVVGEPYHYPDSFVQLLGYMRAYFHLAFRQTEGVVKAHAGNKVPSIPDYSSTISRRVNKLDIKVNERRGNNIIIIALDSTGIKVSNRGEWLRHKWHVHRGYLKIHLAVDICKKVVSLEVTSEEVHDSSRMLKCWSKQHLKITMSSVYLQMQHMTARRISGIYLTMVLKQQSR